MLWYDIFSDSPKGLIHTCSHHSFEDDPDLFRCDNCERIMVDHYTWERYKVELNGDQLCLHCAAKRFFNHPRNWVDPLKVTAVVFGEQDMLFDQNDGQLDISHCPHVLAVEQPIPVGIKFFANAEFDGCHGHQISGENLLDVIKGLDQPFSAMLDAAYQFAVSIGIYVRVSEQRQPQKQAEDIPNLHLLARLAGRARLILTASSGPLPRTSARYRPASAVNRWI